MNLRTAAWIALIVFGLSLALPALQFFSSSSPSTGWETMVFSGTMSAEVLMTPATLIELLRGGAGLSDGLTVSACLSGTGANLLLLFAIGCAFRRRPTAALLAAAAALSGAGLCFLMLQTDRAFQPRIGIWLWIGVMLWVSAIAAWSVWRIEFGSGRVDAALPGGRVPA